MSSPGPALAYPGPTLAAVDSQGLLRIDSSDLAVAAFTRMRRLFLSIRAETDDRGHDLHLSMGSPWTRQACEIPARGTMNSCLVQFGNGHRVVTSRNAMRKANLAEELLADCLNYSITRDGAMPRAPVNTAWIYVDPNYEVGHRDHLRVFLSQEAAESGSRKSTPESVAFEYDVLG
jgi:hypothetical protein